jgi:hypothetical protein
VFLIDSYTTTISTSSSYCTVCIMYSINEHKTNVRVLGDCVVVVVVVGQQQTTWFGTRVPVPVPIHV